MFSENLRAISVHKMASLIPLPQANANKYSRGVLSVIGGAADYPGAVTLAACASQRMGAGYTQVWCAPECVSDVRAGHPSLVVRSWDEPTMFRAILRHECALLVGPGFTGKDPQELDLLKRALEKYLPTVIDGGALTCLADFVDSEGTELLKSRVQAGVPLILTPHAGEALRLVFALGEIMDSQEEIAQTLSEGYYATVVMKGPQTVIWGEGAGYLMNQGTAALAKAGTGDVLAGMIGALLAQGVSPVDAACLGSSLHAHAAHVAAGDLTMVCVTPEDVLACLPRAIKDYLALQAR